MHLTRIGVVRGGPSSEYEVSLNTGANILATLQKHFEDYYCAHDIFIDRQGSWHMDGLIISLEDISRRIDMVFNALHGSYGEDGQIQSLLEAHGIPFSGSGSVASAVGMNKIMTKNIFKKHGIQTPFHKEIVSNDIQDHSDQITTALFHSLLLPVVVMPASSGSSVGVCIVRNYSDLPQALLSASIHSNSVLIEEFIPGIEATCGVVEGFRGEELYALPPIEIRPHEEFFDYEAKYKGKSEEIVPATFAENIKKKIESLSKNIHQALGLRHYSRSDFIIHPRRGIYALEVNTLPGLTSESLLPKSLRAVGSDLPEFVDHVISLSLGRRDHGKNYHL